MAGALIGALRVTLGFDTSEFEAGTTKAQAEMRKFQREFAKAGKQWQAIGADLSKYVTAPIVGIGVAVVKMSGDFESAMNRVGISSDATAEQMKAMKDQALEIGKTTSKSASEAADAMDILAKAGMSVENILNGGAKAAVNLSIATGSSLDPAAAAITDTMSQFKKTAVDLPDIINKIAGAVNESKFDFQDFQMGMSQAGGVAAAAGVKFEDFATVLAGTASQFGSGSDAGTSLKTFIMSLTPTTNKAAEAMEKYGLKFYEANGQMKSMSDIAQMLQDNMGKLSSEDRTEAFKTMFGTDAIRTAIGLMDMGAKGFETMQARIAATDATAQADKRMEGFNGKLEQLMGSLETLAIKLGDSGILEAVTKIVIQLADFVDILSEASPDTMKWATGIALVAAAMGPLAVVFGTSLKIMGVLLPVIARIGPVFTIISTAIGYLIPLIAPLGAALMTLAANPIGASILALSVAVIAVYTAWKNWDKIKPIIVALYNAASEWLVGGMDRIWAKVKGGIDSVKGWFFGLYDAVVGHSYIPDMVDGIGKHIARLQSNMVAPIKKGTDEAKQAFLQLQQEATAILSRLFPEQAMSLKYLDELAVLQKAMKQTGATAEETARAIRALRSEYISNQGVAANDNKPSVSGMGTLVGDASDNIEDVKKTSDAALLKMGSLNRKVTTDMALDWAHMADGAVWSLSNMVSAFKSGDILGGIQGILDMVTQVVDLIRSISSFRSGVSGAGGSGGASAGSRPGFSTGGSFKVGGSGGVDSQLMSFRATPGEMVNIQRPGDMGRREPIVVHVQANDYFDAKVASIASPMADQAAARGAIGGAQMANAQAVKDQRRKMA